MATTPVLAPALRAELGDAAPACLRGLEVPEQERLAQLLAEARNRQHAALERAVEEGLSFLPRVVRAAVTRLLF